MGHDFTKLYDVIDVDAIHFYKLPFATINRLVHNSSDLDGFPLILVKKVVSSLTFPLSGIFRTFVSVGKIPDVWRHGIITPVYISGIASDPGNYRPISLTSVFCKLIERVISAEILQYCKRHGLISEQQHVMCQWPMALYHK